MRFPEWIRRSWGAEGEVAFTKELVEELGLRTVCQSARCPNIGECWRERTATFMLLGHVCTRDCRFCSVGAGAPEVVQEDEPERVAEAVRRMTLRHVVVTSVTRDDLEDGGAGQFARTVAAIREASPDTSVELLAPGFGGREDAIDTVLAARPDVFGHNIETVRRLYGAVRDLRADYGRSLSVLRYVAESEPRPIVKSALMLGLGETQEEIEETLADLREAGCDAVSIGQYLRPTKRQVEVAEFVHPDTFAAYERLARDMGFGFVVAAPFVRSSYRSGEMMDVLGAEPAEAQAGS